MHISSVINEGFKSFIFSTQIKIPADSTDSILEDDFESKKINFYENFKIHDTSTVSTIFGFKITRKSINAL